MHPKSLLVGLIILAAAVVGCKKDPPPPPPPAATFSQGVWVVNEGIYNQTSGTLSYYRPDSQTVENDAFKTVNDRDLGNVVQSMAIAHDKVYIVVNNAQKIEVAHADDLTEIAQIFDLQQPRYCLPLGDSVLFVSQWGNDGRTGRVAVIDADQYNIRQWINTRAGAEQMLLDGQKVYLACTGGYDTDSVVQVITASGTHPVSQTIVVGDYPNSLQRSNDGHIWVACAGKTVYTNYPQVNTAQSTAPALVAIHPQNGSIVHRIALEKGFPLLDLVANADGSLLYFNYKGQLWSFDPQTHAMTALLTGDFYGLGFDHRHHELYAARNTGIQRAWVLRCTAAGQVIDSFQAGVFANGFVFR